MGLTLKNNDDKWVMVADQQLSGCPGQHDLTLEKDYPGYSADLY
jgi:hypothetical protein